jgi:hypothetical protein|tara:strand:- start:49 stop:174 length:126 start_codon:yes stop_codon:yes gene_type:complete
MTVALPKQFALDNLMTLCANEIYLGGASTNYVNADLEAILK